MLVLPLESNKQTVSNDETVFFCFCTEFYRFFVKNIKKFLLNSWNDGKLNMPRKSYYTYSSKYQTYMG